MNAQAALAMEYTRIEAISARVRPMRSARNPKKNPPIADAMSVRELRNPAVRVSMENSRTRYASTREKSMTSIASRSQPRLPAMSVLRSAGVMSRGSENRPARVGFLVRSFVRPGAGEVGICCGFYRRPSKRTCNSCAYSFAVLPGCRARISIA